ncbi:MAG: outer membrane protein assembly factor BamA [Bacteroidaceae bacterium]|nr:outer membrane protein assembly factor BamA [Bacteroidaceae bacterium]
MKRIYILLTALIAMALPLQMMAQGKQVKPTVDYARTPRQYVIGGISVSGINNYDDYLLIGLSGLSVGQRITIPGEEITKAVKRYWRNGLFSNVKISVDSIVVDSAFLHIELAQLPKISAINYNGVKKSEREDLETKMGLVKGSQITPNMLDKAKTLAKRYFDDKGFKNAEITIVQRNDAAQPDRVIVDVDIDKKDKVRVNRINVTGNNALTEKKIKGSLFKGGALKGVYERGRLASFFHSKKFVDKKYKEAKESLIEKYAELGYRDAYIVEDSVVPFDENSVDIHIKVEEGQRYYIRNITWVGNTLYPTEYLQELLTMKKGDVYNQKLMDERLRSDDDAIGNLYYNNGYVFSQIDPIDQNVIEDSIDIEMRITEGIQARLSHVKILGNDRVYESVVRRALYNKPGDLFSKQALERSYRDIASMGHFDAESINYDIQPNADDGTVDLTWGLTPKSNDQIEFSLGYGQTGVIGKIGLKFSNFCLANIFKKDGLRRGVMPQGNGETFSVSGQTNGRYYQAYSVSYVNPWFGGKRPNQLSFSAFFSKQTDVSDNYYNSAYYQNYYNNYLYGYGSGYGGYGYGNNFYENYYDPDQYVKILGASLGWGKRLRWPDDYFTFMAEASYTRYMLKDWKYFLVTNGSCNNVNLSFTLSRSSTFHPIFPRSGSEFLLQATFTPPFSLWDKKEYKNLANNPYSSNYNNELQDKYRWIEYHKWKFKARTFTQLTPGNKCLVLMTRVEVGLLGHYNQYKKSPFETFYMGGDGTSGYSYSYGTETIGLRGYENGSLTPQGRNGYAYDRFTLELRYPLMLGASTNIYALAFAEAGNAWTSIKKFNPFDMKRSAGLGVRIFLPMIGLLGIDWAYGFDSVYGSKQYSGSQFHFILGQEF